MAGDIIMLQDYLWTEETWTPSVNFFWDPPKSPRSIFWNSFRLYSHLLGKYASTIPKQSAENFFHWIVKNKLFGTGSLFLCRTPVASFHDGMMRNHCQITCMLGQKFLVCIESCSFILVSQLFGYPSHAHFCVSLSNKVLYSHVGNSLLCSSTDRSRISQIQHSVERDYRQDSEGGSRDQTYQSRALLTTILEQI